MDSSWKPRRETFQQTRTRWETCVSTNACEPNTSVRASGRARLRDDYGERWGQGASLTGWQSRWLGVMTTRAAGSTSANWGQPCQTTAIGCWETNVVVLNAPFLAPVDVGVLLEKARGEKSASSRCWLRSPISVTNFETSPRDYFSKVWKLPIFRHCSRKYVNQKEKQNVF